MSTHRITQRDLEFRLIDLAAALRRPVVVEDRPNLREYAARAGVEVVGYANAPTGTLYLNHASGFGWSVWSVLERGHTDRASLDPADSRYPAAFEYLSCEDRYAIEVFESYGGDIEP